MATLILKGDTWVLRYLINPNSAEAYFQIGYCLAKLSRYPEAVESCKRAIQIKPGLAETHLNLGMTYLRLGDRGSALEQYKILKDQDKELANRLFNLIYE